MKKDQHNSGNSPKGFRAEIPKLFAITPPFSVILIYTLPLKIYRPNERKGRFIVTL